MSGWLSSAAQVHPCNAYGHASMRGLPPKATAHTHPLNSESSILLVLISNWNVCSASYKRLTPKCELQILSWELATAHGVLIVSPFSLEAPHSNIVNFQTARLLQQKQSGSRQIFILNKSRIHCFISSLLTLNQCWI